MLLLLSSCHLWSGCDHPIHQICQIDLFLLTGHVLGDGIYFMNSFCCAVRILYCGLLSSSHTVIRTVNVVIQTIINWWSFSTDCTLQETSEMV